MLSHAHLPVVRYVPINRLSFGIRKQHPVCMSAPGIWVLWISLMISYVLVLLTIRDSWIILLYALANSNRSEPSTVIRARKASSGSFVF